MYYTGFVRTIYAFLYQFDLVWIFGIMILVMLALIAVLLILFHKINKIWMRYELFMKGRDCESLEDNIFEIIHELQTMQSEDKQYKEYVLSLRRNMTSTFAKSGLVKYNAFPGMAGESSFALTLLNMEDDGYILDAIHSRESCMVYLREIHHGETSEVLTEEENESLKRALAVNVDRNLPISLVARRNEVVPGELIEKQPSIPKKTKEDEIEELIEQLNQKSDSGKDESE